jgi:RNA polymerase sigma-70 factor (ECF subfamily)
MDYSVLSTEELVKTCAESGNAQAWEEFVRRFHKVIASTVSRFARRNQETRPQVIVDLVQDTYLKILANDRRLLREFKSRHPDAFYGMLKVTAANVARDYFRARRDQKHGSGMAEQDLPAVEPFVPDRHGSGPSEMEREVLLGQINRVLVALSSPSADRDRNIFWLYYRQGFTAKAIADITSFELTTKGVESILFRLTRQVRAALVESAQPPCPPSPLEGIPGQNSLTEEEGQP